MNLNLTPIVHSDHPLMKQLYFALSIILLSFAVLPAQNARIEICDNAIDDDGVVRGGLVTNVDYRDFVDSVTHARPAASA